MHSKLMASWDEIIKYMIRIGKGDRVFVCVCVCVCVCKMRNNKQLMINNKYCINKVWKKLPINICVSIKCKFNVNFFGNFRFVK